MMYGQPQPQQPMVPVQPMMSMAALGQQMIAQGMPTDKDPSSSTGPLGYSSPSGSGSPPWSPPSGSSVPEGDGIDLSNLTNPSIFSIELLQKPRGSNGRWLAVEPAQRIRVAAKLGKMLKIVIRTPLPVSWDTMNLLALERSVSGDTNAEEHPWRVSPSQKEAFSVLARKVLDHAENADGQPVSAIQLDIKLYLVYRSIAFLAEVTSGDGRVMRALSVSLSTHNSGSSDGKRKRDRITHDEDGQGRSGNSQPLSPEDDDYGMGGMSGFDAKSAVTDPLTAALLGVTGSDSLPGSPSDGSVGGPSTNPAMAASSPMSAGAISSGAPSAAGLPGAAQDRPWQVVPGNLQVEGVVRAHGYSQFSDIRLKTDIADIVDAMKIVSQLQGKSYKWKKNTGVPAIDAAEEMSGGKRVIGLIAQEVQRVLPEVVQEGSDGYLAVNYADIVPILIEAFKEQVSHFKDIRTQVAQTLSKHANHQDDLLDELGKISAQIKRLQKEKKRQLQEDGSTSSSEETSSSAENTTDTNSGSNNATAETSKKSKKSQRSAKNDSQTIEMDSLIKKTKKASKQAEAEARAQQLQAQKQSERRAMIKAGILLGLLALTVGMTLFLGLFFGLRNQNPTAPGSSPPVSFVSRNYVSNGGFEEVDPSDATKARGWTGEYVLHGYALARKKRDALANNFPLVSNASMYFPSAGNYAIRTSIPYSFANLTTYSIAATTQSLNIAQLLADAKPTAAELSATTGLALSVWANAIYAPRDVNMQVEAQNAPVNGTIPAIKISAATRDKSGVLIGQRLYQFERKLSAITQGAWFQLGFNLPFNVTDLGTMDLYLTSTAIGDIFWDNVGIYFTMAKTPA